MKYENIKIKNHNFYMVKGLPASGKTTLARKLQEKYPELRRVNKDDLRNMLDNNKHSKGRERGILAIRDNIIFSYMIHYGCPIISDDTNLNPIHENKFRELCEKSGYEFNILDLTTVPLEECIDRDKIRPNTIGEKAIRTMYNSYLKKKWKPMEQNENLPNCVIVDLDGTLALFDGNPYDRDFINDRVNMPVKSILACLPEDVRVIITSGRNSKYSIETRTWLNNNLISYNHLYMRDYDDKRPDTVVKKEMFDNYIKDKYHVNFVIDDRPVVVRMWREMGLFVFDVNQSGEEF